MICVVIVLEVKEYVACTKKMGNAYNILVVKPEVKRLPGRTRHRQDDIIKVNLKTVWCGVRYELNSSGVGQGSLGGAVCDHVKEHLVYK
jgi:hypothetical protein